MRRATTVNIGPFTGIDNVHAANHAVFQPGEKGQALAQAVNVNLRDDGWVHTRPNLSLVRALSVPLGMWELNGRCFVQQSDALYEGNTPLITGLRRRVNICEHWGSIFVTDGTDHYEITGTTVRNWGLPVPGIALSSTTGTLAVGKYIVQVAFVDASGNEGGTSPSAALSLSTVGGITLNVSGTTSNTKTINIYISEVNQKYTSFLAQITTSQLPYRITSSRVSQADPPRTELMMGPIANAQGMLSYRAFLLMWRNNAIFRSEGAEPHLFHGNDIMQFPTQVKAAEGLTGGMWIGTSQGIWWVQGDDPISWTTSRESALGVAWGSAQIDGAKLPALQLTDTVAMFASERGLLIGSADGKLIEVTPNSYNFTLTDDTRASFAFVKSNGLQQLFISLVG